jgi:hypothetical protein
MSELLKINVNEHLEKKNGLSYLSWAWAWSEVLKLDPSATWEAVEYNGMPVCFLPDQSALVKVRVTIKDHSKTCVLPVMNHRNQAIKNPDAFAINTAIVRCLVKCIALFGLGLYVYSGEDTPEGNVEPLTVDPRGDLGKQFDETVRDEFVRRFRGAFDLDAEENVIAQAVLEVHKEINSDHDMYIAVADSMTPKERSAIKAYLKMAKEAK